MSHSDTVLARFHHPRFAQQISATVTGVAGSKAAGALVELHLRTEGDNLRAGFRAYGCPATIASMDWLAEQLDGATRATMVPIDRHAIIRALALPPARQYCAALAIEAMREALGALGALAAPH